MREKSILMKSESKIVKIVPLSSEFVSLCVNLSGGILINLIIGFNMLRAYKFYDENVT